MITRPYLESTTSSRSSIGGLMMPSGAEVPATVCLPVLPARSLGRLGRHQGYQLTADVLDRRVNQRDIELAARAELGPRGVQPLPDDLGRFCLPDREPADQLRPGRRVEKDQQRPWHRLAHLPGAGHVDLQQRRHSGAELLGEARRRLATTVLLPTPDGPESTVRRAGTGACLAGPRCADGSATDLCPLPPSLMPAPRRSDIYPELVLECRPLVGAEAADAPRLRDAEPLHDLLGAHLADAGHGFQQC